MLSRRLVLRTWPTEEIPPWAAVWPETCGRYTVPEPEIYRLPDFYCVHLVTKGKIHFRTSPEIDVVLSPGQMFAVWAEVQYDYRRVTSSKHDDTELHWVRLKGPHVLHFLEAMGFTRDRPNFTARDPDRVKSIMNELTNLASSQDNDANMRAIALLHIMAPACQYDPGKQTVGLSLAERARQLMESELSHRLHIEDISQALHVSRSTLFLHCKREFGKNPMAVLMDVRIAHARKLLEESLMPISQIAFQSGYTDPLYFSRCFSKETGMSPREYRRNLQGSE